MKLPQTVTPLHYSLDLTPNFDTFEFTGKVVCTLKVNESTSEVIAHALELLIQKAWIQRDKETCECVSIQYDQQWQTVRFKFSNEIKVGIVTLHLEFKGYHNDQMAGFYRSGYTLNGVKKYMMVTQFCATDCRRCFPCWDEPALKATFDVTLRIPKDQTALSNMNSVSETFYDGLKVVKFARTPLVSTYLLCIVVGEFDYLEALATPQSPKDAQPIKCRVYTLPGQQELGRYALGVSTRTLEYFSDYFDVAYPLPKLDMVAIPDFGVGAMENWGLVTYREAALLYDPTKSSAKAMERVGYTVCHEISHQWFGNLVSPRWWSDIWLNEGFATIVGWQAIDQFYKEWNVFTSFVTGNFAAGQSLDSMRSSHPIEVEANTPAEIGQIFDAISYSKGASVIRMLNNYLGKDVFSQGVRKYLKKHQYGNATTTDLWESLSEVSGQDIGSMMESWIKKIGFPFIKVVSESFNQEKQELVLELSQQRFLSSGDIKPEEDETIWSIPIQILTNNGSFVRLLDKKTGTISFPYQQGAGSFWKLNESTSGVYRVLYQKEQLEMLTSRLNTNLESFSPSDRIGILSDVVSLAKAGFCDTTVALSLIKSYKNETAQVVLQELLSRLDSIKKVWSQNVPVMEALNAIQRSIFSPLVSLVGFDYPKGEEYLDTLKRNLVLQAAAESKDKFVLDELINRFKRFQNVFKSVLLYTDNPSKDFQDILDIYKNGTTVDERMAALESLGAIHDVSFVPKILEMTLDPSLVKPQDMRTPLYSLASNPNRKQVADMLWSWLTQNWSKLHETLGAGLNLLGQVVQACTHLNVRPGFVEEVDEWMQGKGLVPSEQELRKKQVNDAKRSFDQVLESIKASLTWYERDNAIVVKWTTSQ